VFLDYGELKMLPCFAGTTIVEARESNPIKTTDELKKFCKIFTRKVE
jgi:16S rRNA C1402 N4-methylase RsmH